MRNLTLRLFVCLLLATRVIAAPIYYSQIAVGQNQLQADSKKTDPQQPPGKITESGEKPEFVRLIDGRVVPYGAGIICSDECVQSDALSVSDDALPRLPGTGVNPWLWSIPAVVGGIVICAVLCRGGSSRTIVSDTSRDITPTPPPATDVPEPATLVLLGLGLAMVARHGFGKKKTSEK